MCDSHNNLLLAERNIINQKIKRVLEKRKWRIINEWVLKVGLHLFPPYLNKNLTLSLNC